MVEQAEYAAEAGTKRPWWVLWVAAAFVAVIVVLVVAFSSRTAPTDPSSQGEPADSNPGAYSQSWTKPYSQTTCSDWSTRMSDQERFATSADILTSAWVKIEASDDFPPDRLIREFQRGISSMCTGDDEVVTDVTYRLYNSGATFKP